MPQDPTDDRQEALAEDMERLTLGIIVAFALLAGAALGWWISRLAQMASEEGV